MHEPRGALLRVLTAGVALATLAVAADAWVTVSRPFDPPQQAAMAAEPTAPRRPVPVVPDTVTVLTYHAVTDKPRETSAVTRQTFAAHLAALAGAGYRSVRLSDVRKMLDGEQVDLPPRAVLVTFDGGAITDWTAADPILARYGFHAAGFLSTARLVRAGTPSKYLSHDQVERLAETGRWEFGGRTDALDAMVPVPGNIRPALTHRRLRDGRAETLDEWRGRVADDLARSQRYFTQELGAPAYAFAYPFGDGGQAAEPAVRAALPGLLAKAGYRMAFVGEGVPTGRPGAVRARSPQWLLPRVGVRTSLGAAKLLDLMYRAQPVAPPAALTELELRPDQATALQCRRAGALLAIQAARSGMCEDPEINTTRWRDYTVSGQLVGASPRCTGVLAVRTGTGTGHYGRAEVAIGHSRLAVRQQILDGPRRVLAAAPVAPAARRAVQVRVERTTLTVQVAGAAPVRVAIDRRLAVGGIAVGVETTGGCLLSLNHARITGVATG